MVSLTLVKNNNKNLYDNFKTVYDMVNYSAKMYKKRSYIRYIKNDKIYDISYNEIVNSCQSISLWLENYRKRLNHQLHVAIIGKNTPQFAVTSISIVYSGAVSIPLSPYMSEADLEYYLNYFEVDILVYDNDMENKVKAVQEKCPKIVCCIPLRKVENSSNTTSTNDSDNTSSNEDDPTYIEDLFTDKPSKIHFQTSAKPETCCFYILTSGTTGKKKGVMISNDNVLKSLLGHCSNYGDHDYRLTMLPFSHCCGGIYDLFFNMRFGVTLCMNSEFSQLLKEFLIYQPYSTDIVPMVAKLIYDEINKLAKQNPNTPLKELKSRVVGDNLRLMVSTGAPLDSLHIKFFKKIGINLQQFYGMTECTIAITQTILTNDYTINSAGIMNKYCQIRSKEDGEIQIKGPIVMLGYYKNAKKETDKDEDLSTGEVGYIDEDGWLNTGDIGYVDKYGYVYITGRKKNLIILSNGENISPNAIETQFSKEELINEIVVFGHNDSLHAEIFPNFNDTTDYFEIKEKLQTIINNYNQSHPSYENIAKFYIREKPFGKTETNKINRKDITFGAYYKDLEESSTESSEKDNNFNEIERSIYDLIKICMHETTPIQLNTNFFDLGLNSLSGMLFIKDIKKEFDVSVTINDLFKYNNIKKLGEYISTQIVTKDLSAEKAFPKQKTYNITPVQYAFIYFLNKNFTANLPNLFKIDDSIDLDRLRESLIKLIDMHPDLKAQIYKDEDGRYKVFRDDSLEPVVQFYDITDKEWDEEYSKNLLVEYQYEKGKFQYNIVIFNTDSSKYLFFDINHAIADGETVVQLIRELNEIYHGKELPPITYTYYEYLLEEKSQEGIKKNIELNKKYYTKLLENFKGKRSVFTKEDTDSITRGAPTTLRKPLESIDFDQLQQFCKKFNISENILFLTAFGFCVNLFSDDNESILTTVHNGRSTLERERLVGVVAANYYYKFRRASNDDTILNILRKSNIQVLEAMNCKKSATNYCELFFQYQGDVLTFSDVCGKKGKRIDIPRDIKVDTYAFHLQIHKKDHQFTYELNYWENRMDIQIIKTFLTIYESVINGMIQEINNSVSSPVSSLRNYIPSNLLSVPVVKSMSNHELHNLINNNENNSNEGDNDDQNIQAKLYVLSSDNNAIQPYGAWGNLFVECDKINASDAETVAVDINNEKHQLYKTDKIYQILPDGTLRPFENTGNTVMISKNSRLFFINLKKVENALNNYKDISSSEVFITYTQNDQLGLKAIVTGNENIDETDLNNYLKEHLKPDEIPTIDFN